MAEIADRPDPSPEDIKASYGFVALLAEQIPEINDLLVQAIQDQWTPDRFIMSVANTDWYQNTPPAEREWITKQVSDPAGAEADIQKGMARMMADLQEIGIGTDVGLTGRYQVDDRLRELYITSRIRGIYDDEVARKKYIYETIMADPGDRKPEEFGGTYGKLVGDMHTLAKDYGYRPDNLSEEIMAWTNAIMISGGTGDATGWRTKMINYASSMYAPYAEDIRGGKTLTEVARPVVDRVSQLLEMNPSALDTSDPIMKKALTEWGAEGRAYTLREIEDETRKDKRWLKTDNAMESSAKMLTDIGQRFGMLAGGGN